MRGGWRVVYTPRDGSCNPRVQPIDAWRLLRLVGRDPLYTVPLCYLGFPCLTFLAGWLRPVITVPLVGLLLGTLIHDLVRAPGEGRHPTGVTTIRGPRWFWVLSSWGPRGPSFRA
jgi:hypothetical protein